MSALRITEADLQQYPHLRKRLGLEGGSAESGRTRFEVSWYSPKLRKRVAAGALIEAQTKGGAIAEVKASFAGSERLRPKGERPVNFIAVAKKNPGMFGPEAVRDAKQVTKIRRVRHRHTREPGEIISAYRGGWVKVKLDNADQPALAKRSELELVRRSKRNPAHPFFCADCDDELKGNAVEMKDGREVCPRCAQKAKQQHGDRKQGKLFDEQLTLLQNGKRQNVEMGFIDPVGVFHPIRKSKDYNEFLTSDVASPAERRARSQKYQTKLTEDWYRASEQKRGKQFGRKHKSLSQFVRSAGGIAPPKDGHYAGELAALRSAGSRKGQASSGLINQWNRQGSQRFGPEYMMDAANAEGYRDRHGAEFENIGNFLDAVADDVSGIKKLYSHESLNEYYNPMPKAKKQSPAKRSAKRVTCSKCGGAHDASYCNAKPNCDQPAEQNVRLFKRNYDYEVNTRDRGYKTGTIKARSGAEALKTLRERFRAAGVKSVRAWRQAEQNPQAPAKQNVFGLGQKKKKSPGAKRRAAKRTLKADRLEARARYLRALGNPANVTPAIAKQLLRMAKNPEPLVPRRVAEFARLINQGKFASRAPLLFHNGNLTDGRHRLAAVMVSGKTVPLPTTIMGNPMHPLEIGSHIAMILSGVHTAGEMTKAAKKKKARRPSATAAGRRLAQRKHGSVRGQTKIVKRKVRNGIIEAENLSRTRHAKRNHGEIFEEFTGKPSTRVLTGYVGQVPGKPKSADVDLLGPVLQFAIEDPNGKEISIGSERDVTAQIIRGRIVRFNPNAIQLNAIENPKSRNGNRRFVIGVRALDREKWLGKYPWAANGKHKMGVVAEVVYGPVAKPHLGVRRPAIWYHILGEEGGQRPIAYIENGCPVLRYGGYDIKSEGIRN